MRRGFLLSLVALTLASPAPGGTILFLGDSLTAGLGVQEEQAYPALIQEKIREKNLPYRRDQRRGERRHDARADWPGSTGCCRKKSTSSSSRSARTTGSVDCRWLR